MSIISCLLLILGMVHTQSNVPGFENISQKHHLLHTQINDLVEGQHGFIWIGSNTGLHRYDGLEFKSYYHDPLDSTSLSNPGVIKIVEDQQGDIWLTTNYGIDLLDRRTATFRNFAPYDRKSSTKSQNNLNELFVDSRNRIWTAGIRNLFQFDRQKESFIPILGEDNEEIDFFIREIIEDPKGNLWAASSDGLHHIDPENIHISPVLSTVDHVMSELDIISMELWNPDRLILGTTNGLYYFDILKYEIYKIEIDKSIDSKTIRDIHMGKDGLIYLAIDNEGLCIFNPENNNYVISIHNDGDVNSIHSNSVKCILEDRFQNLWFGTSAGLSKLLNQSSGFTYHRLVNGIGQTANQITRIHVDIESNMWFNTALGLYLKSSEDIFGTAFPGFGGDQISIGDWLFEIRPGELIIPVNNEGFYLVNADGRARLIPNIDSSLENSRVYKMLRDVEYDNVLWIGTTEGLARLNTSTKSLKWYKPQSQIEGLNTNRFPIYDQLGGNIWLYYTYFNSMGKMDKNTGKFELLRPPEDQQFILEGTIRDIGISMDSNIWLATMNGLARYDIIKEKYDLYTTHNGLAANNLNALVLDDHGKIWVSGDRFISKFDPVTERFQNFEALDKVKNFLSKSRFKDNWGTIFFGGLDGYYSFHPDSLQLDIHKPDLVLTDFKVHGKTFLLDKSFEDLNSIVLNPTQNDIAFDFVGIQLVKPEIVKYRCKLQGYDEVWRELGEMSSTNYTNLNHGDYIFRVQSSTVDGQWNSEELTLRLKIKTPMLETHWFKTLVALLVLLLLYLAFRLWSYQQLLRRQKEIAEKSSEYRMQFLANASHEIRTPMNAILGMSALVRESKLDATQKKYLNAIEESSINLLSILNELLDHSRIESGKYVISKETFELKSFLDHLSVLFETLSKEKNLHFNITVSEKLPKVLIGDKLRLNQILTNIVANAIKYTDHGGVELKISAFSIEAQTCTLKFDVHDTGRGMNREILGRVFEKYSKTDQLNSNRSSGLGLYITKELVDAMDGEIRIESAEGAGTKVTCIIPLEIDADQTPKSKVVVNKKQLSDLSILIVDDADFNHLVLNGMLESALQNLIIYSAYNGEEAIDIYKKYKPDLIIMDAKMPVLDGLEASAQIRTLEAEFGRVLILGATAGAMPEQVTACLESGMDDVIIKPIEKNDLLSKMTKLLERGHD